MSRNKKVWIALLCLALCLGTAYGIDYFYSVLMPQHPPKRTVQAPQPDDRILVFSPHPDDETIAVGGYVYDAVTAGAAVRIVLVTDGNKHGLERVRYREFRNATGVLGVNPAALQFWGYPDGRLKNRRQSLQPRIAAALKDCRPTIVLYPSPFDYHPDHSVLGKEVQRQLEAGSIHPVAYRYLVHYWLFDHPKRFPYKDQYFPTVDSAAPDSNWYGYHLSSPALQAKKKAIRLYKSQLHSRRDPFLKPLMLGSEKREEIWQRWKP